MTGDSVETIKHNKACPDAVVDENLEEIEANVPDLNSSFMRPICDPVKMVFHEKTDAIIRGKNEMFGDAPNDLEDMDK